MKLVTLTVGALLWLATPAYSQTISLQLDGGDGPTRALDVIPDTSTEVFTVTTLVDLAGDQLTAVEWFQTPLSQSTYPGVFTLGVDRLCSTCDYWLSDPQIGMFIEAFGGCLDFDEPIPVIRISYGDFNGVLGPDIVLTVRGLEETEPRPSSFDGSPGFVDCNQTKHVLEVSGGPALVTGSGVVVPSGSVVLNPTPVVAVGSESASLTILKASFK